MKNIKAPPQAVAGLSDNQLLPRQKLTQHILQNAAVLVVFHFDFVINAGIYLKLETRAVLACGFDSQGFKRY